MGLLSLVLARSYGYLGDTDAAKDVIEAYRALSPRDMRDEVTAWPNLEIRNLLLDGPRPGGKRRVRRRSGAMSDVFISYARETEAQAQRIAEALRTLRLRRLAR